MKKNFAKKISVKQINESEFVKGIGWEASHVLIGNEQISLANVMGIVVEKSDNLLIVDDGTGSLVIRNFEKNSLDKINVGDAVQAIGNVSELEGIRSLRTSIISKVDIGWLKVRRNEIVEVTSQPKPQVKEKVEVTSNFNIKDNIIEQIKNLDEGTGVEVSSIIGGGVEYQKAIDDLIQDGEIYEITPGRVKVLE